ncbi:unnamed protein product [Withania somnifera]
MLCEMYYSKPISYWILLFLSCIGMLCSLPLDNFMGFSCRMASDCDSPSSLILFLKVFPTPLDLKLTISYVVLCFLTAADNLMYGYAYAYLPASTAALLASTSLVFSALFGYLLVKNTMNLSIINSIVIITAATTIIALDSSSDRFGYITDHQYIIGFVWDILGSALHGLIFALSDNGFHGMKSEASTFEGGANTYYSVIVWGIITFQLGVLGATAVVFLSSTVLAGVLNAVRVPITSIAAVILLHDPMSGFKILSLIITFWGFGSYIYGSSSPATKEAPETVS